MGYDKVQNLLMRGEQVQIAMDAEWGAGPQALSLLQLAIRSVEICPVVVVIVDLRASASASILTRCRELLYSADKFGDLHQVLAFSPHNDIRRLVSAGILPDDFPEKLFADIGWCDLQLLPLQLGETPGLHKVVKHCLGA